MPDFNPYEQPTSPPSGPDLVAPIGARPRVYPWFLAYCAAMTLVYLVLLAVGVAVLASPSRFEGEPAESRFMGGFMVVIGLPLMVLFALPFFLPKRPGVWIFDIVLIAIGLTSCATWPATIPLLIFWLRKDARAFFGRE